MTHTNRMKPLFLSLAFLVGRSVRSESGCPARSPSGTRLQSTISNQGGFTYLVVMFFVVLIGITLMAVGQEWSVIMKRDREAELAFRGHRIKEAIERFVADHEVLKGTRPNKYPLKLEELTKKAPRRYLPVIYKDPITGQDFELIKVGKDIRGVRSTSLETPMDQLTFKGATTYHAIRFEAAQVKNCGPNPLNPLAPTTCAPTTSSSSKSGSISPNP